MYGFIKGGYFVAFALEGFDNIIYDETMIIGTALICAVVVGSISL